MTSDIAETVLRGRPTHKNALLLAIPSKASSRLRSLLVLLLDFLKASRIVSRRRRANKSSAA